MPIIGSILGGVDFSNLAISIGNAKITYGIFIQNIIDFLIIAFCVFIFVKFINKFSNLGAKKEEKIVETELSILKEIRDELKNNKKTKTTKAKK